MVVVIITLALIAIPNYTKSKERALQREAISNIKLIAAAERVYKMEKGSYVDCNCSSADNCRNASGCNTILSLMLNTTNWQYGFTVNNPEVAYAWAVRQPGAAGACDYTLLNADFDTRDYSTSSGNCY